MTNRIKIEPHFIWHFPRNLNALLISNNWIYSRNVDMESLILVRKVKMMEKNSRNESYFLKIRLNAKLLKEVCLHNGTLNAIQKSWLHSTKLALTFSGFSTPISARSFNNNALDSFLCFVQTKLNVLVFELPCRFVNGNDLFSYFSFFFVSFSRFQQIQRSNEGHFIFLFSIYAFHFHFVCRCCRCRWRLSYPFA